MGHGSFHNGLGSHNPEQNSNGGSRVRVVLGARCRVRGGAPAPCGYLRTHTHGSNSPHTDSRGVYVCIRTYTYTPYAY